MTDSHDLASLAGSFTKGVTFAGELRVRAADCTVKLLSNSDAVLDALREYFAPFLVAAGDEDITIIALERDAPDLGLEFRDWPRDPGKVGRKEAIADIPGGRVIHKVRTGMQFLVGPETRLAVGACLENYNQVVNFLNAQIITAMLDRGYALCHAAGVVRDGAGLAIAARSGGGKSTLAMHLMSRGFAFTSNDRLLVKREGDAVHMAGIPKMPRINPGTVLNNPDLDGIVTPEREQELLALERSELWGLEEKYDVMIGDVFGGSRFAMAAPLDLLMLLNWSHASAEPARFERVDLADRPDLLPAIMKPPGPFYMPSDGGAPPAPLDVDPEQYLHHLGAVTVIEASGGVDFEQAMDLCERELRGEGGEE